ncbi:hypothetical protein AKJ47_01505 [candidate division MSBL1 archaeon SCGC-AAA261G05]|uniref:Thioredoxin domain-containing protein n=2 Tax=candidate division MSBL1 TaxID=215777 RepID=A0A133V225_9EURY|nr:hypothetical protein AKJ42_00530 [candidate division MSBL1 archaeon SCGC-AAA261C02]KXB03870.1 hypothetical protein AKJ47_01505 [candidate division MSBL1 archaeon SCGC-AAA261G05]
MQELASSQSSSDLPTEPITLSGANFEEASKKFPLLVVDYWAVWCPPCKALEPIIEELAEELSGKVVFGKLNIDENRGIAQKFGVSAIPTLLVMKDGREVDRVVGLAPKNALKEKLLNYLED